MQMDNIVLFMPLPPDSILAVLNIFLLAMKFSFDP